MVVVLVIVGVVSYVRRVVLLYPVAVAPTSPGFVIEAHNGAIACALFGVKT